MRKARESAIVGFFEGWQPETTYQLEDGSCWCLTGPIHRSVILHRPKVVIYIEEKRHFMEVSDIETIPMVTCLRRADRRRSGGPLRITDARGDLLVHVAQAESETPEPSCSQSRVRSRRRGVIGMRGRPGSIAKDRN